MRCLFASRTISLVLVPLVDQAFIAMGNARLPMKLHALSLGLNIAMTPVFIYDLEMGIAGAALASNLLARRPPSLDLSFSGNRRACNSRTFEGGKNSSGSFELDFRFL